MSARVNRHRNSTIQADPRAEATDVQAVMEPLEGRLLLSLLGITQAYPYLDFDSGGSTSYESGTVAFDVDASPISWNPDADWSFFVDDPRRMEIRIGVSGSGGLVGPGTDTDLVIEGAIDTDFDWVPDLVGTLLTGRALQFGYLDTGTTTDTFDFRFLCTGGALAPYFAGQDIGVWLASEGSSFTGSFEVAFGGGAKGYINPIPPLPAALGDYVWEDANRNGVQETGETPIDGVTVNLYDGSGGFVATTTTAGSGYYLFDNLTPGDYHVEFIAPGGYVFTSQDQGSDDAIDSDANPITGVAAVTTLVSGERDMTWDAGLYRPVRVGDYVWVDTNANGLQDDGATGVPGVLVTLYEVTAGPTGLTDVTDAAGLYLFDNLPPGDYYVVFDLNTLPSGYVATVQDALGNTQDALDSDANQTTGQTAATGFLFSGQQNLTLDMGIVEEVVAPLADIDIEKFVKVIQPCGGEGLTPGYWKQCQHFDDWTGYTPGQDYGAVFGVSLPSGNKTLLQALGTGGGGMNALLRHSVAALLNAAHSSIDYAYTTAQIIAMVQQAFATGDFEGTKNLLETQNELGADLSDGMSMMCCPTPPPCPPPPPPDDGYGEDADEPTGPQATAGQTVVLTYVVTNPGEVQLDNVTVVDDNETPGNLGDDFSPAPVLSGIYNVGDLDQDNRLDVGEIWLYTHTVIATTPGQHTDWGTATGTPVDDAGRPVGGDVTDADAANYIVPGPPPKPVGIDIQKYVKAAAQPCGGEGLTPGYWKQCQHFDDWMDYTPWQDFETVFEVDLPGTGHKTLLKALGTGGGGVDALMRHAVAALLNAAHPGIDYAYTVDQVKTMVRQAFATGDFEATKNLFEAQNELGADLHDGPSLMCNPTPTCPTPPPTCPPGDGYGDDADEPTGPVIPAGQTVILTYVVTNTGEAPLAGVTVVDDNETPDNAGDDFAPDAVMDGGFNIGDADHDGMLDVGETWIFRATEVATTGQHTDVGAVTAVAADNTGRIVSDDDAANYFVFGTTAQLGSIGDFIWHDRYHGCGHLVDGIQDAGEEGIANVLVNLLDASGGFIASTSTNATGYYEFIGLSAGTYVVEVAPDNFQAGGLLGGWYATLANRGGNDGRDSDGDLTTHRSAPVVLSAGEDDDTVDFGFFRTGIDLEKTGPASVYVSETITYKFRVVNTGDVVLHGGAQVYDALINPCGDHLIWSGVIQPGQVVEFSKTYTKTCTPGEITNTATATGHPIRPDGVALANVHDESAWTVDVLSKCKASVGDFVWEDLDRDGLQDCGEPGIAGVKVDLLNAAGQTVATTTTGSDGRYLFDALAAGEYGIRFAAPDGFEFTTQDVGSNYGLDSDADAASGQTALFTLAAGQAKRTIDAGLIRQASCGGEGLTPGYWKQRQHFDDWAGYTPTGKQASQFEDVFGVSASGDWTLLDALKLGGGGEQALARHAVAALLNAASSEVDYLYSVEDVIMLVQSAYDGTRKFEMVKNMLAAQNELGCR